MLGHFSSVEDRQRFVEGKPDQPITENALMIKCRDIASARERAFVFFV
jgi:hypothetical protein